MRVGVIILCLLGFFGVNGQRYTNLNVFEGDGGNDQTQILVDQNNFYSLNYISRDSLFLNKTFIARVAQGNNSSLVLSKFEHNVAVKNIHLESHVTFGRIYHVNDRIWVTGYRQSDFFIDGELKYVADSIVQGEPRDRGNGFILIYDKDLNLERSMLLGAGEYVKAVTHANNKYYIAGNFGLHSTEMTLDGISIYDNFSSLREMFLFTLNDTTYKAETGISFGGPGSDSVDRIHVDDDGNILLLGSTISGAFFFGSEIYPTSGNPILPSVFLIKVNKSGLPVFFHFFDAGDGVDNSNSLASEITVDDDGNIYIGTRSPTSKFRLNNQVLHESPNQAYLLVFLCFTPEGPLKWSKEFDSKKNVTSIYRKSILVVDEIIFGGFTSRNLLINDGEIIQNNDSLAISGMIKLDKETGDFKSYQDIVTNFGSRLYSMHKLSNDNYLIYLRRFGLITNTNFDTFFVNHNIPSATLIFEFNPEIPQIISTLDEEKINNITEINIFPNPIQNESKLSIQSNEPIKTIEMYDINGRLIERISAVDETTTINSNQLPGTYILKFQMETQGSVYKKLIIQ
ncbi:MAG: T9SS type A sorting domain-containing protein [Saprospiraceae bacterium]|nr:T9SS type A sorting domain-containing protein [Saprospiraceae bacterium]MBP6569507.1 T9SS type A sorting domain-containing protein [Saprospiraceae bacterium]